MGVANGHSDRPDSPEQDAVNPPLQVPIEVPSGRPSLLAHPVSGLMTNFHNSATRNSPSSQTIMFVRARLLSAFGAAMHDPLEMAIRVALREDLLHLLELLGRLLHNLCRPPRPTKRATHSTHADAEAPG